MRRSAFASVLLLSSPLFAAHFADSVISANQGTVPDSTWNDSAAALGAPDGLTGENPTATNYFGFPNVLGPFSSPYQGDEIYQIGAGGQITLHLAKTVNPVTGPEIGVFEAISLFDIDYPNGKTGASAVAFGADSVVVEVSQNGSTFVALNSGNPILMDLPANAYLNAGPYDSAAPTVPQSADFGKPYTGTLAGLSNMTNAQVVSDFNGSAGGNWLDISSTGLAGVNYIRFSLPADASNTFELDSVSISNSAVPEPASLGLALLASIGLLARARRQKP